MESTKSLIFSIILLIAIIGVGGWYVKTYQKTEPTPRAEEMLFKKSAAQYVCREGGRFDATFIEPDIVSGNTSAGRSVEIAFEGGDTLSLVQVESASGAKYANADESRVFWAQGNGALMLESNEEKTYKGCMAVAMTPSGSDLAGIYVSASSTFSLRIPAGEDAYVIDEAHAYQANPAKILKGTKFTIPTTMATGTNLSGDTYISVESIAGVESCSADLFLDGTHTPSTVTENGMTYSVASSSNAGAGNRYEEVIYALSGTQPCIAFRYFIHYTAAENYEQGAIQEFDRAALIKQFDTIRSTLVLNI
jgi:membrane-bound inhibitor of C-type lysozyme